MIIRTKELIVVIFFKRKDQNVLEEKWGCSGLGFLKSRERKCAFSLDYQSIGPSDFFEARRKVVIRYEGNAWASVLRSFDKLREVGVLSYLSYTLFQCFVMLVLI